VNAAMRGVLVPAGPHILTMRYRPSSVIWGAVLTLVGILGALAVWWICPRVLTAAAPQSDARSPSGHTPTTRTP
jgi:hypothetical protein